MSGVRRPEPARLARGGRNSKEKARRSRPAREAAAARRPRRSAKRPPPVYMLPRRAQKIEIGGEPLTETATVTLAPRQVPVLPVRHTVLFPFALLPLNVGRPKSLRMLNDAMAADRTIAVFAERQPTTEDPADTDLHRVGTLAVVLRMIRMPDEQVSILVQGLARVHLDEVVSTEPYLTAKVSPVYDAEVDDVETAGLAQALLTEFERIVSISPTLPAEVLVAAKNQSPPGRLADFLASLLELPADVKQPLLEMQDVKQRLHSLTEILARQHQVLEVGQQIQEQVQQSLDQRQKEFLLRQQLEAIQKELGEGDESRREIDELKEKIEKAHMPEEVRREADRELARLARIPPQAPEYTVARTYLEWMCEMPWAVSTEDDLDLKHARAVLDEDHYGLDKIKERILEFLAVRRFKRDARTPILCFVGPPGTGKTSLGMSIAKALGRKFIRQSLGGVRDEAEIRGHRRTYIGALPGNILRGIRRAGSRNPLFMLDEIDKLGADFHGDPSSALLEVLDPEQNGTFTDHYLDVPFDLSQVLFVTTANYLDPVPPALRDRMEVIELAGYTDLEKLAISRRHLIPKAIRENGLEELNVTFGDEAILKVVRDYTSEAGLRNLERELANLLRRTAKLVAEGEEPPRAIDPNRVRELLGPERFQTEQLTRIEQPGAALGLAWTPAGGEVLMIEATVMPGSKQLLLTGQLGEVMRESAHAALSYVRSHAGELGIDPEFFESSDIHVHLPSGAIPKDGPSAGVTMCTALVSLLTGRKVRTGIAMTGEITLLGRVLPIGGLKEKVLAAHRAGINTVIIPTENQKGLDEIPVEVRSHMIFAPVDRIEQVLGLSLEGDAPVKTVVGPPDSETAPSASDGPETPSIQTESVVARRRES